MAPLRRYDFRIAIICALSHEAEAVIPLFDNQYGDYGRSDSDRNQYTTGRIGNQDVVLAYMPGMGKRNAATVASNLRSSFPSIELALIVGICGGVPTPDGCTETVLGDVVLSESIIEYDFGRQYPGGFQRKIDAKSTLPQLSPGLRSFVSKIKTHREDIQSETFNYLLGLQDRSRGRYQYPGRHRDVLYEASYRHKGVDVDNSSGCECVNCRIGQSSICIKEIGKSCPEIGCNGSKVERKRLELEDPVPLLRIGTIASGDTVMKSGEHRNKVANDCQAIAFEMEGAGAWDVIPCLVLKGICDYADSHKSKDWQEYAAATAACSAKAILTLWTAARSDEAKNRRLWIVPFQLDEKFVGREDELYRLMDGLFRKTRTGAETFNKMALYGLGGIGKTSIALKLAERVRETYPDCSIFWVPSASSETFEQAFRKIGKELGLSNMESQNTDVKKIVKEHFDKDSSGRWLMIFDNADNVGIWYKRRESGMPSRLADFVPRSGKGCALLTTRNKIVAGNFASNSVVSVKEMDRDGSIELLRSRLEQEEHLNDRLNVDRLIEQLCFLPLALTQAASFISQMDVSIEHYLTLINDTETDLVRILSRDFEDDRRYSDQKNPAASTWIVSFEHIRRDCPLAARYLSLLSCVANKAIPGSFLPQDEKNTLDALDAITCLKSFSFISQRQDQAFDMHRLVGIATRAWLEETNELAQYYKQAASLLDVKLPCSEFCGIDTGNWRLYEPHINFALTLAQERKLMIESRAKLLVTYTTCLYAIGRQIDANVACTKLLELQKQLYDCKDVRISGTKRQLGLICIMQNKFEEAEKILSEVIDTAPQIFGQDSFWGLETATYLGWSYYVQGKFEKAETFLRSTLKDATRKHGKRHIVTLHIMQCLIDVQMQQGQIAEAEKQQRHLLQVTQEVLGADHWRAWFSTHRLCFIYTQQHRYREAKEVGLRILDHFKTERSFEGMNNGPVLNCIDNLASLSYEEGKYAEAEQYSLEVCAKAREFGLETSENNLRSMDRLRLLFQRQGMYEKAAEYGEQVLEASKLAHGENHPIVARLIYCLASIQTNNKRYEMAGELLSQAVRIAKTTLGQTHVDTLDYMTCLGCALFELDRSEEAISVTRDCFNLAMAALGPAHELTATIRHNLEAWGVEVRFECNDRERVTEHVEPQSTTEGLETTQNEEISSKKRGKHRSGLKLLWPKKLWQKQVKFSTTPFDS